MGAFKKVALLRRVIVNLDDGTSIQGILYREPRGLLVLKNATYHEPGAEGASLDGDTLIPRERIAFVQAP